MTDRYVPAAGRQGLTRSYDRVLALTMREARWRPAFVAAVLDGLPSGGLIADVGSGTGSVSIALAEARSDASVVGIDGDPEAQAIAREKPGAQRVRWRAGLAQELPLEEASADRVVMSLLLHHLSPDGKHAALQEARRVLRPGGRLHVADWGRPGGPGTRLAFFALQLIDGFENTRDHAAGRLPDYLAAAGFTDVTRQARVQTGWGTLELLRAHYRTPRS